MRVFSYLPGKMAPLDRHVFEIYKKYLAYNVEIVNIWKRGVYNGLMAERSFADIIDARLRLEPYPGEEGTYTPVISITPVLGETATTQLTRYVEFFKLYEQLRAAFLENAALLETVEQYIIAQSDLNENTVLSSDMSPRYKEVRKKAKRDLHNTANLAKLLITAFHIDDAWDHENPLIRFDENDKSWIFVGTDMVQVGGHVIGPKFQETGEADKDYDSNLIKAIRRYALKSNQEDLHHLIKKRRLPKFEQQG